MPTQPLHNVAASQEIPYRWKRIETCKFEYHQHRDGGLYQNGDNSAEWCIG